MIDVQKTKLLIAIKKSEGMMKKLYKMVEDDAYCIDVAQQLNAAVGLMKSANALVLENHLHTCWKHKLASDDPKVRAEFIDELVRAFSISNRK